MIRSTLTGFLRHLRRHKGFATIHVFGLSVGLASAVAVLWFVHRELNYDTSHKAADRIFRLVYDETARRPVDGRLLATTSPPMAPTLQANFPQIEQAVRLRLTERDILARDARRFYEDKLVYADQGFFQVFSFPLAQGDVRTALAEPNSVVLSAAAAVKYFGGDNPVGQRLRLNDQIDLKITGVLEEITAPTHLEFDFIVSFSTFKVPTGYPVTLESWAWVSFHTYFKLAEGTDVESLGGQITEFVKKNYMDRGFDLWLQPVTDIYLGRVKHADLASGSRTLNYGLALVGLLILVVASLNYVNLATARSMHRAREVGIRKIVGARPKDVIIQFLSESVAVSLLSAVLSMVMLGLLLELLGSTLGISASVGANDLLAVGAISVVMALVVGCLAGLYPALLASRFEALRVIKGFVAGRSGSTMRNVLVTIQFAITIGMVIAVLVINDQMTFISRRDLGYNKEAVVALQMIREGSDEVYPRLRTQLLDNPGVKAVTGCSSMLDGDNGSVPVYVENREEGSPIDVLGVQYDFISTLQIRMHSGREFDRNHPADLDHAVVLNLRAVEYLGLEDPVGKKIRIGDIITEGEVIGVVDDFNFSSLRDPVKPLAVFLSERVENMFVRLDGSDLKTTVASVESDWRAAAGQWPFQLRFLDDYLASLYRTEERLSSLLLFFGFVVISVACLGLYGLVSFMTVQRSREIGIRKVLGAGLVDVIVLLSRRFVMIVLVAGVLVTPVSLYIMEGWLGDFAYHIELTWVYPGIALVVAFACAWIAMGYECVKAGLSQPVKVLKQD